MKKKLSRILSMVLVCSTMITALPTTALAYFVSEMDHADESYTGSIPITNEDGTTDILEYDETWEERYPYGAFVFGTNEAAANEDPTDDNNTVTIPVYRLGGTEGRATVYLRYQPMISQDGEDSLTYAYAASGRDDLTIQVEDPQPVAKYQPVGAPHIYAGCDLNMDQGVKTVVDEESGDEYNEETGYQVLSLALDDESEVESCIWQVQVLRADDQNELYIDSSWSNIADALSTELEVPDEIWFTDDALYDFRCIYTVDGKTYCTSTAWDVPFEETTEELEEMPDDLELNAEPTYTTLYFENEYDVCDFELTFAEGEWVKNIIVTVTDDDIAELPEMGLFTMTDNVGGEIYQLTATMTMLINDNDPFEPSELGFTVDAVEAEQDDGSVVVTVQRTGGTSYPVSVRYEAVSGTAVAGKQFSGVSGTLLFAGDVDSIDISIPLIAEKERDEALEFTVQLSELQGGTQDELCSLAQDVVTVTLTSTGKAMGMEAGLNLASVLATASGEDISAGGYVDEPMLPGSTTVIGTQDIDDSIPVVGTYTESSNGRTYTYEEGIKITRPTSGYKDNYWADWENAVGTKSGDSSGTMEYWNGFNEPEFIDGNADVETNDVKKRFEKSKDQILLENNNSTSVPSILTIDDGFTLFEKAEWSLSLRPGIARYNRKEDDYLYVMPHCRIVRYNPNVVDRITELVDWNGNVGRITSGSWYNYSSSGTIKTDFSLDDSSCSLKTWLNLFLNKNEQYNEEETPLGGTNNSDGTNGTTIFRLTRMSLKRRKFTNTSTLGLKIHTANDADSGLDSHYAQLDKSMGVYDKMKPIVSLVPKQSGVDSDGNLYVGSKLQIELKNTDSYAALVGKNMDYAVYVTDENGNKVGAEVTQGAKTKEGNPTYYITMIWDNMTEDDLTKKYTINVVMERQQTVELNITTSLPDGISENDYGEKCQEMWGKMWTNGTPNITYTYSKTDATENGLDNSPLHYTFKEDGKAGLSGSNTADIRTLSVGSGTTFSNLQSINFNLSPDDIILYENRSFAGNETIYLNQANLASGKIVFYYYNKDALSMSKTMVPTILQTALYYDTNGNGKIDGYFDSEIGYFVEDGDQMLGFVDGEFDETFFQPVVDSNGTVHQYFLKAYYTMNPRSYQAPAGASSDDTAMVLPLFMSTITNKTAFSKLSTQQQSYRYLQAGYSKLSADATATDSSQGKPMYGAAATARSYVDIPLGGDTSPATYGADEDTNLYNWTWKPDYKGNLIVDFDELQPIYNDENITGESVAIAGEEPRWKRKSMADAGTLTFTEDGAAKLNGYLGSFTANNTFGLAVQETTDIDSIYSISPESVVNGNVKAIPNGDYLTNMESTGSPESASGGTDGKSAMPEFESDLGVNLPSTNFQLSSYASIIMDGYKVGFSIGLPVIDTESYTDENGDTPGVGERAKEANESMTILKEFMTSVKDGNGPDAFKKMMKDDYNKANDEKGVQSKKFSVSFSVALAILFEYNPIDNTYYFKQASIAANAGLTFTLQYRFTPVPILYVYLKTGFEVGLTTGLSVERTAKQGKRITAYNWLNSTSIKGFDVKLNQGESVCFTLDMKQTRGFMMNLTGNVYMEVFDGLRATNYREALENDEEYSGGHFSAGRLSSDGSEPVEVFLPKPENAQKLYVIVTALEESQIFSVSEVNGAKSLVYWNGITFSPSGFLEVGAGIGIELLKFELYLKAQMGLSFTIGGYSEEAGSYRGAQLNNFDLALSMGFNVTVLFFNYSMDLIGYYLHIENTTGTPKVESKWGAFSQALGGDTSKSISKNRGSLVSVSAPTDTSETQRVVGDSSVSRAYNPTDDNAPFQLSGYGSSGDGFKLMDGLSTANSYQVFRVGSENYLLYTQSRSDAANPVDTPQLVLSRLVLTGDSNTARLQNPAGENENFLCVDNDDTGDLDYGYSVNGNILTVVWTSYDEASNANVELTTVGMAEHTVVKSASIDLSADSPEFSEPIIVSDSNSQTFRFLPQQEDSISIYAESDGEATSNTQFREYLKKVYELTDAELNGTVTDGQNYDHAAAIYRWNYQRDLNEMYGANSKLVAYYTDNDTDADVDGDNDTDTGKIASVSLNTGEVIENIETTTVDDCIYVVYSTVQNAYFGSDGETVSEVDSDTDLAAIKRLYLRSYDNEQNEWSEAKLLQTVIDFDRCTSTNIGNYKMKDGVYSEGGLVTEQTDPYFSNLKFLRANLSGSENSDDTETVLLYEMGGNTYLIRESDLQRAMDGNSFTASPIFKESEGSDAVISSDSEGNLAVVYTAPMTASGSNALYVAWWDGNLDTWGSGNVLAMNHLQVFEDGKKYGLTDEELEKAYLGLDTENNEYEAYLNSLEEEALESAKGAMEQLRFSNLQITLAQSQNVESGDTHEQLLVLTQGSLQKLITATITNPANNEEIDTVRPDPEQDESAKMGFYAISFGAGQQGIGQANLSLTDYNFTAGTRLSGTLTFTNTGTVAIRASNSNPATVELYVADSGNGYRQTIATWSITENVPSGASVELPFSMTSPLTANLSSGTVFSASVTENQAYVESSGGKAFTDTVELLKVEDKPELQFESFSATITDVSDGKAVLALDMVVSNRGQIEAGDTFVQFTCENEQGIKQPLDLTGSNITVDDEEDVQARISANELNNGVIYTNNISSRKQRRIHGTLNIPLDSFLEGEFSGLQLKAEIFSGEVEIEDIYSSDHSDEYCASNNIWEDSIEHETFFYAPKQISTAMGNTLRLPITYASTSNNAEVIVREVSDGTEDWSSSFSILYFESDASGKSGIIVAAPGAETAGNTGILQLEDLSTNSIYSITYQITELGSGINIFSDDESFTFYEADGSKTDVTSKTEDWIFNDNVPTWDGGINDKETPMNNNTVVARVDDAYLTFQTVADTITLWFDGEVTVSSDLSETTSVTANSAELRKTTGQYPLTIEFFNDRGAIHTVTIKAKAETVLDRYTATYSEDSEPVQNDAEAPHIYWDRSFPDTASLETGESVELTCYVVDDSQLLQITGIPNGTFIEETTQRFWSFKLTVTENGLIAIKATDVSGRSTTYPVRVDWFNTPVSEGTVATAPDTPTAGLKTENGSDIPSLLPNNEYPYLKADYELEEGETITVRRDGGAAIDPEEDGRWKLTENGTYLVRVTAEDGSWSQSVLIVDMINDSTFTLSVQHDEAAHKLTARTGGRSAVTALDVNGYDILETRTFTYTLSGTYVVTAVDQFGITVSATITVAPESFPLTLDDDAVTTEICTVYGEEDGKIHLMPTGIHGGSYDSEISDTVNNSYLAKYSVALLTIEDGEAELDVEAVETAEFIELSDEEYIFEELATGWYQLLIRDSVGSLIYRNVFVDTEPLRIEYEDETVDSILPSHFPIDFFARYDVIVENIDNGSVTTNPKHCKKGQTVTIVVTPEDGYTIQSITAVTKSGELITLELQPDGSYLMIMPGENVLITPVFAPIESMNFLDVPADAYYYDAVLWAVSNGITTGVSDTLFAPDRTCSRAQAVTFLWRAAGCPAPESDSMPFTDVESDSYYHDAVLWAMENGITMGTSDTAFSPDAECSRAQIVAFLYRFAMNSGMDVSVAEDNNILSYTDALDVPEYAFTAIQWACGEGIMQGSNNALLPNDSCTRAQIVTFLYRYMK